MRWQTNGRPKLRKRAMVEVLIDAGYFGDLYRKFTTDSVYSRDRHVAWVMRSFSVAEVRDVYYSVYPC